MRREMIRRVVRSISAGAIAVAAVACATASSRFYTLDATATADGWSARRAAVFQSGEWRVKRATREPRAERRGRESTTALPAKGRAAGEAFATRYGVTVIVRLNICWPIVRRTK